MRIRRQLLSALLLGAGIALLVAATTAGVASSATSSKVPSAAKSSVVKRGGTLNLNSSNTDFDFVDPGLAYNTLDWEMLYTTQLLLVNFPEKAGPAGGQIYPEGAAAFPIISKDGKTYTFQIRPGQKFSDGSP